MSPWRPEVSVGYLSGFTVWGSLSLNPGITDLLEWLSSDSLGIHLFPPLHLPSTWLCLRTWAQPHMLAYPAWIDQASPDSQKWLILGYSLLIMWQIIPFFYWSSVSTPTLRDHLLLFTASAPLPIQMVRALSRSSLWYWVCLSPVIGCSSSAMLPQRQWFWETTGRHIL